MRTTYFNVSSNIATALALGSTFASTWTNAAFGLGVLGSLFGSQKPRASDWSRLANKKIYFVLLAVLRALQFPLLGYKRLPGCDWDSFSCNTITITIIIVLMDHHYYYYFYYHQQLDCIVTRLNRRRGFSQ